MKKYDKHIALFFGILTLVFFVLMQNTDFFQWVFKRHQNQLSWYIRPLFLIPFCFFAYQKSWAGIAITIFSLFTSMFWFSIPEHSNTQVESFLAFEQAWIKAPWTTPKILLVLTVPISFIALGLACWNRSVWIGLSVIVLMASGKIIWSIWNAGDSGKSIIIPAIIGLCLCILLVLFGYKRLEKKNNK